MKSMKIMPVKLFFFSGESVGNFYCYAMADDGLKGAKNPLEQFLLLAKNAKGVAAAHLIRQATEAPGVYVFGELMTLPNITEVPIYKHI